MFWGLLCKDRTLCGRSSAYKEMTTMPQTTTCPNDCNDAFSRAMWAALQPGTLLAFFISMLLLLVASVHGGGWALTLTKETGAFEQAAFISLAFAALLSAFVVANGGRQFWSVPVFIAFLALRELDFHNWWFEPGLLQIAIFTSPVPVWHQVVSGLLIAVIGTAALHMLWMGAGPTLRAVSGGELWAKLVALGLGFAALSSQIDGLDRKLAPYGIEISDLTNLIAIIVEETVEVGFAFATLSAVVFYARRHTV